MPRMKTSDGVSLYYQVEGREGAPPLVFSNSLGTNLSMWDGQMEEALKHFHIIRYDHRGHGRSDAPAGRYTQPRLGQDVVDLLDHLNIRRAAFCGLSMGGMAGIWLAANAPDRITRAALCNTSAYMPMKEPWDQRIATVEKEGLKAIVPAQTERWFTARFREESPAEVQRIAAMIGDTDPTGYLGCAYAVRDMDLREDLKRIDIPVLVVIGRHDPATPPEHGEVIASTIPGADKVVLEAAHLSNVEAPEEFNRALVGFLTGME
jgi:3-oxoadipate enol-lactonase